MSQYSVPVPQLESFQSLDGAQGSGGFATLSELNITKKDLLVFGMANGEQLGMIAPPEFQTQIQLFISRVQIIRASQVLLSTTEFEQIANLPLQAPTRVSLLGIETLAFGIGKPLARMVSGLLTDLSEREQYLREREIHIFQQRSEYCHSSLVLDQEGFGKICVAYSTRENAMYLYGDIRKTYLPLMEQVPERGVEVDGQDIFSRMRTATDALDRRNIYHINIPWPAPLLREKREDVVIVGGGNAYFDAVAGTLHIAGRSGSFGSMSDKAVLGCLEQLSEVTRVNLSRELVVTPENVFSVGEGRLKAMSTLKR